MKTERNFNSGDVLRYDGDAYHCICADDFAAVFGKLIGGSGTEDGEIASLISCNETIVLSNEGPTTSNELLLTEIKEVNIPGFRSREYDKEMFSYELLDRNPSASSKFPVGEFKQEAE